jgi:glycosyltransferase involved in cell wall biosynthesis
VPENNPVQLNIVQVTTEDIHGGAAIAAYRLYTGLRIFNQNVRMLVKNKKATNPEVIAVLPDDDEREIEMESLSDLIHQECIQNNRTAISTTLFSYPIFGYDFTQSALLKNADIINLHWINFFCSLSSLKTIVGLKKPIVWTLHDQWLLTGGCHYTSGCDEYLKECLNCPQLAHDEKYLPHFFLEKKRELIREMNPVLVTPSNWLADITKRISVFRDMRVEVIPNSIDTALYTNIPKETARKRLNLPLDGFYLLFSVNNAFEKRKGIHHLSSAFHYCREDPIFFNKVMTGEVKLMCFGDPGTWVNDLQIPLISLGEIKSERDLCTVYSAADVFLLPSMEDNLPNVVIEAMSCGTPAIAFDIGGIPDMIQNGVNGYIVEKGSESDYARVILDLINDPEHGARISQNCRTIALEKFSLDIQAKRYMGLYYDLVLQNGERTSNPAFSTSQSDNESLPDASDIDTYTTISEILKEIAAESLVIKEMELRLIKAKEECNFRSRQIDELRSLLKKPGTDSTTVLNRIDTLSVLLHESESDCNALIEQINELKSLLKESGTDSIAP